MAEELSPPPAPGARYEPSVRPSPPPSREEASSPEAKPPAPSPDAKPAKPPAPAPVVPRTAEAVSPPPASRERERERESVLANAADPGELPVKMPTGPTLSERIGFATTPSLKTRRARIEARIFELSRPVGEAALELDGIRRTKQVDLDRVLKKLTKVEDELFALEEGEEPKEGILGKLSQVPGRLADKVDARELRTKRARLVSELGLAILACELRPLRSRARSVADFAEEQAEAAREIDGLFRQMRLVEDELAARARDGRDWKPPKMLDTFVTRTGEVVDDVSDKAAEKLKDLGKTAARAAAKGGMTLAKGAFEMGKEKLADRSDDDEDDDDRPRRRSKEDDDDREDDARPRRGKARKKDEGDDDSADGVTARLRRLRQLHEEGVLTDEEFAKKKEDLLRRL